MRVSGGYLGSAREGSPTIGNHWDGGLGWAFGVSLPNHWGSLGWRPGRVFGVRKGGPHLRTPSQLLGWAFGISKGGVPNPIRWGSSRWGLEWAFGVPPLQPLGVTGMGSGVDIWGSGKGSPSPSTGVGVWGQEGGPHPNNWGSVGWGLGGDWGQERGPLPTVPHHNHRGSLGWGPGRQLGVRSGVHTCGPPPQPLGVTAMGSGVGFGVPCPNLGVIGMGSGVRFEARRGVPHPPSPSPTIGGSG